MRIVNKDDKIKSDGLVYIEKDPTHNKNTNTQFFTDVHIYDVSTMFV